MAGGNGSQYVSITAYIGSVLTTVWLCNGGAWEAAVALVALIMAYAKSEYDRFKKPNVSKEVSLNEDQIVATRDVSSDIRSNEGKGFVNFINKKIKDAEFTKYDLSGIRERQKSLKGRFVELENFNEVESGKKIKVKAHVDSVSKKLFKELDYLTVQLKETLGQGLPFDYFSLYLPQSIERRVYALREGDLILFEGILLLERGISIASLDFELLDSDEVEQTDV